MEEGTHGEIVFWKKKKTKQNKKETVQNLFGTDRRST